jgi:Mg2+ and Co2+ transporter CorA
MNIFIEWVCPALFMIFLYTFLIKKYYKKTEEDKTELEDQRRETVRMSNYLDTKQEDLENSLKNNIHLIKNIMIFLNQLNQITHEII